ncbi:hypothetical protein FOMPIDRAFT_1163155 [Fomitopsis schrenkii]|uniref:ATP phosphoribosyltransferase n=1 Tax=Fomitopsis schrenkii TaxID=2126942 RepID=S8EAY6_FOMSC|nr:hypothetical protein FOMPIDRAFT_1163155 [Fomitopsis schrenkii]
MPRYKLVFFTPTSSTQTILAHLFAHFPRSVGRIGLYGGCAFVSRGTGQFVPQEGAQPAIGQVGTPERVEEDRVEVVVHASADPASGVEMHRVLEELKKVHPYEEVAYDVYKLEPF